MTCGAAFVKIKNLIYACSIVSRGFFYASNEPLCGTLGKTQFVPATASK